MKGGDQSSHIQRGIFTGLSYERYVILSYTDV